MNILLTLFLSTLSLQAAANQEYLLKKYQVLQPYHESLREPMPVKQCKYHSRKQRRTKQKQCRIEIEYEAQPQKLQDLLKETENSFDTSELKFLSSNLGKEYQHLKSFMNIYNEMEKCRVNSPEPEDAAMTFRFEEGASEALFTSTCESCHSQTNQTIKTLFSLFDTQNMSLKESAFQDQISAQALEKNIQSRVLMASKFMKDDFHSPAFTNKLVKELCQPNGLCPEKTKNLLKHLIDTEKNKIANTSTSTPNVLQTVNQHIAGLNSILEEYNSNRESLLEQQRQEKKNLSGHTASRGRLNKIQTKYAAKLKKLKESVFRKYQAELAQRYSTDIGRILRTQTIHTSAGFIGLEKMNSKLLGIQGFEETVLTHKDPFPRLSPINSQTAKTALNESFSRANESIRNILSLNKQKHEDNKNYKHQLSQTLSQKEKKELDEWYKSKRIANIEEILIIHPDIISQSLTRYPEYSSIVCTAVSNISKDEKKKALIKNSITFAGAAGSVAVAVIAPYVGLTGLPVMLAATSVALTSAVVDYTLRTTGASEHRALKEKMLNAYLSETGDHQSIEDIRYEWRRALAEDLHARWAIGFGLFDITRAGTAIRTTVSAGRHIRKTNTASQITKNRILLSNISQNKKHERALLDLLDTHSQLEVRNFLRAAALFPPKKQRFILNELPNMAVHPNLNLPKITAELKKRGVNSNVRDFLIRYSRCVNCKAKPGIKVQKGSQKPPSS